MKDKALIWIFAMVSIAAAMAISASAGSHNPESYWGYVYIETAIAPSGTVLTLESTGTGEVFANQSLPYDVSYPGSYSILLNFDDPYTGADEGAELNEYLTWKVNGITATTPAAGADTTETGKTNNNFRIDSISAPVMSAAVELSTSNINLSSSINLNVTINNTGQGSGNATLASLSDASINSDLPKTIAVAANSTNYTTVNMTPTACGQHTPSLNINYYNIAGALIGTINKQFSFNVTGADLILSSISLSNSNPSAGETISIMSTLLNNGTVNITGFTARFYYDSTLIATISSDETIRANESIGLSANWAAVSGASTIKIDFTSSGTECYTTNNEISTSVSVKAAAQQSSSSGGGGGGGRRAQPQCNDTVDNDDDGLIDYPADTGCESASDDDETDIIEYPEGTGGHTEKLNQTSEEEPREPEAEGPVEEIKALAKAVTGFTIKKVVKQSNNIPLILLLILLVLIIIYLSIKKGRKMKEKYGVEEEKPKKVIIPPSDGPRVKIDVYPKHDYSYPKQSPTEVKKQHRPAEQSVRKRASSAEMRKMEKGTSELHRPKKQSTAKEHTLIQKSIKISSKKDIIDKIKEVHKEND